MHSLNNKLDGDKLRYLCIEYGMPLLVFALLSLALTWPTIQHFSSGITSRGGDARHNVWILWHVKEALLGREPLFHTSLLYYPHGISLLTHAVGPVEGLFALPFWLWNPQAAYNGALLVGLWLTGYFMYLLVRGLGLNRTIALFAGIMLMTSEMTLAGILGHIEKTFIGFLPLVLLMAHRAFSPGKGRPWSVATSVMLLLTLLHHGLQFVLVTLAIGLFAIVNLLTIERSNYHELLLRIGLMALSTVVIVGPLLLAIVVASSNPAIPMEKNFESFNNQPDLVELFFPSRLSRLFGAQTENFLASRGIGWSIETTISVTFTGLILGLLAFKHPDRFARWWLLFATLFVIFSLGPTLKVFGKEHFTDYHLPVILPYAILTSIPGLDFLRTPGQFMLMGFVGLAVASSFGLAWLSSRFPGQAHVIIFLAIAFVLIESWPQPWPEEKLRPVPEFYRQIADEKEVYGVFDLPIKASRQGWEVSYASYYQIYQMSHRKGIASGYLSRTYDKNPLFPCLFSGTPVDPDVLVNGEASNCYDNAQYELSRHNYRYVVWHKPQEWYQDYVPGSWGEQWAQLFIDQVFDPHQLVMDDILASVYLIDHEIDEADLTPTLVLGENWHVRESDWRWAASPAMLKIISPRRGHGLIQIIPVSMHDPRSNSGAGSRGLITLKSDNGFVTSAEIKKDHLAILPIEVFPGVQTITLTLQAGNFRPSDYGQGDRRLLSFAIRKIDLRFPASTFMSSGLRPDD